MKLRNYTISITIFLVFLLTSIIPVIQVILMYWNGGLLAVLEEIVGIDTNAAVPVNLIMSIISLFGYFKSQKKWWKITTAIFSAFFINGLIIFSFDDLFAETEKYWIQFVLESLVIGISLFFVDTLRSKKANK